MTGTATAYGWSAPSRKALMLRPRDVPLGQGPSRSLLRVLAAVTMVAVLAAAGTLAWLSSSAADDAAQVSRLTNAAAAVSPLVYALQDEQTLSTAYARADGPRQRLVRLQRQQQAVDQASADFRRVSADPRVTEAAPAVAAAMTQVREREQDLAALRADVSAGTASPTRVRRSYAALIDAYRALPVALAPHIERPTLSRAAQAQAALDQAIDAALAEQVLMRDALRVGRLGGDQQQQLAELAKKQQAATAGFRSLGTPEGSASLDNPRLASAVEDAERTRQAVLRRPAGPFGGNARRWQEASADHISALRQAQLSAAADMKEIAAELDNDAGGRHGTITLLATVAVASTLLLGVILGRRSLRRKGRQESSPGPIGADEAERAPAGTAGTPPATAAGRAATPSSAPPPAGQHHLQPALYPPTQDVLPGRPLLRHPVGALQPATALPSAPSGNPGSTQAGPAGPPPASARGPVEPAAGSEAAAPDHRQIGEHSAATASMALSELTRLFGSGHGAPPATQPGEEQADGGQPGTRPVQPAATDAPAKR